LFGPFRPSLWGRVIPAANEEAGNRMEKGHG